METETCIHINPKYRRYSGLYVKSDFGLGEEEKQPRRASLRLQNKNGKEYDKKDKVKLSPLEIFKSNKICAICKKPKEQGSGDYSRTNRYCECKRKCFPAQVGLNTGCLGGGDYALTEENTHNPQEASTSNQDTKLTLSKQENATKKSKRRKSGVSKYPRNIIVTKIDPTEEDYCTSYQIEVVIPNYVPSTKKDENEDTSPEMMDYLRLLSKDKTEKELHNTAFYVYNPSSDENIKPDTKIEVRRSTRKVIRTLAINQQVPVIRSKKLNEFSTKSDIKKYYLDKTVKRLPSTFETIIEEPIVQKDSTIVMESRKFKRLITFNKHDKKLNEAKIKKRRQKIKKVFNKKFKTDPLPMDLLKEKLEEIE